ncbi:MAG TPA: chromosome segregation SMC family protein, partial [Nitrososphaera sp.]
MVHIKKLEVYGFKSFGFKNTVVNFDKGLVAVTGPNGSGKSNILDAIMFAIGETSTKTLRVDKMQSLFHDSQNSSHRLIRVSLTFENDDRGIPVDSDTVTLTRQMEGETGESKYSLNGKPVAKAAIMELLEVVLAAPSKLNIVQQGMITRISELNSEERRKIIEEIVGLSYFDEKKAESIKQLDEADRRLEVAFARMGEIRKRIDELEAERNDQIRYEQISAELKRFRAVQTSNSIRKVRQKLSTSNEVLDNNSQRSASLSGQLDQARQEIEKLDSEKTQFIQEVDAANKAKAQVASRLSVIVHESERTKAMLGEAERRIVEIERRLPAIEASKQSLAERSQSMRTEAEQLKTRVDHNRTEIAGLRTKLDSVDAEVERIGSVIAKYASFRQRLEKRLAKMSSLKGRIELAAATLEEKIKTCEYKRHANEQSLDELKREIDASTKSISEMSISIDADAASLRGIISLLEQLAETKRDLESEISDSSLLLSRADTLATKFEERASIAKNAMNEDLAIAELMKDSEKFGIEGLVHDLVRWDGNYERAILAAGSEWMKAFVVDSVASMILIAAYAKERRLPRLRIIPRDVVARYRPRLEMPSDDVSIIGRLSDFVFSDNDKKLASFLFSDTIVTRSSSSAYALARQGYRAVSVEGELFEPAGGSMSLDFGSRITDLTDAILLGDSVDDLRDMLSKLSATIAEKQSRINAIAEKVAASESERVKLDLRLKSQEERIATERESLRAKQDQSEQAAKRSTDFQSEYETLFAELGKLARRLTLLGPSLAALGSRLGSIGDESSSKTELAAKNLERSQIVKALDDLNIALNQSTAVLGGIESRTELESRQLVELDDERQRLTAELENRRKQGEEMRTKSLSLETELRALRDQEQQVIDSSGDSYSVLQDYERKIKALSESERKLSKEHNLIERESALLRKDVTDLTAEESRLTNDLVWLGYKNLLDEMDVATAIKELAAEDESVKKMINLRADESYVQVMDGYRGMSGRKNQLENERGSIVAFIQHIEKEKKDVFMEAFQR